MKLYYSPGACSQAPHILLHEIGLSHEAERVDLKSHTLADGSSYYQINQKGSVPALQLDNGEVLTENAIVLQYLGDRAGSDVLPPVGDFRRYRVLEMDNFITTELHKRFSYLFRPDTTEEMRQLLIRDIGKKLDFVEQRLGDGPFLFGEEITLPDVYLFVMASWTEKFIGLDPWPNLTEFRQRMLARPSVRHVLRFEGLLEEEAAI